MKVRLNKLGFIIFFCTRAIFYLIDAFFLFTWDTHRNDANCLISHYGLGIISRDSLDE